jgi:hypothetical protein
MRSEDVASMGMSDMRFLRTLVLGGLALGIGALPATAGPDDAARSLKSFGINSALTTVPIAPIAHRRRHRADTHRYRRGRIVEAPFTRVHRGRHTIVEAPFAFVYVGPRGRYVRAPFVDLWRPY